MRVLNLYAGVGTPTQSTGLLSFPEGAAAFFGMSVNWMRKHAHLPGVIVESQKARFFDPVIYREVRARKWKK